MSAQAGVVSPWAIAEALGLAPPTDEQAAVIAAELGPTLVVAGAGAGKTETMAARVVWAVANGLVLPEQVLGLTFTRKAAQQLAVRIRTRLARLAGSALLRRVDPDGRLAAVLATSEPEVSTYHAYAGRLLSTYGLLLPLEPSVTLLTETQLWQLAYRVVTSWDGDLATERTPVGVTEAVLALAGQLAEHLVTEQQLVAAATELEDLLHNLPKGPRQRDEPSQELQHMVAVQWERVALLPLVNRLTEQMRRRGALDFGSRMCLAARLAAEHPDVGVAERRRFHLVLLDEYQDTGHAQRVLLTALFGDPNAVAGDAPSQSRAESRASSAAGGSAVVAVTAVGDPMQSIYGWRGASAANLPRFTSDFPRANGCAAPMLSLLTSWRNPPEALAMANLVADPLRQVAGSVPVDALRPRPEAPPGSVVLALTDTVAEERTWIAEQVAARWQTHADAGLSPPSSAVLVRRNADAAPLAAALREQGLPVEIVGLGGLLATAEVADVVATLRLLDDPGAGDAAMRILTGARWRLGISDLAALAQRARELSILPASQENSEITNVASLTRALRAVVPEPVHRAGLADAIADPGEPHQYSPEGSARIRALARELAQLREHVGQPLPELVAEVERVIGVGVEASVRRAAARAAAGNSEIDSGAASSAVQPAGREHLDAFADVVAGYAADHHATLTGLLAFLAAAEEVENGLAPGEVEVARDRVQVLTVHAAKGLEWEVVALAHVVKGVFPASTPTATWLGSPAELPPALRGDRRTKTHDGIPVLDLSAACDRADLEHAVQAHRKALQRRRLDEERRLFYVAITRTERALFVSGHHWPETGTSPRGPSVFLRELAHTAAEFPEHEAAQTPAEGGDVDLAAREAKSVVAGVRIDRWAPAPALDAVNPAAAQPVIEQWPRDPLGPWRRATAEGAELVRDALAAQRREPGAQQLALFSNDTVARDDSSVFSADSGDDPEGWAADVDALLAEWMAGGRSGEAARAVELPTQLPATALVGLQADPTALATQVRRPLPRPPTPFARRGTAFHAWVQQWFRADRLLGLDDLPGAADAAQTDADLLRLQEAFLASPWANRTPVEVEVDFETTITGTVIRGRIDAVFAEGDGWLVVDWKTGAEPTPAEEPAVAMQLAVYRLAWARLLAAATSASQEQTLKQVSAAFHYVRSGRTIAPPTLAGPKELAALIETAAPARGRG